MQDDCHIHVTHKKLLKHLIRWFLNDEYLQACQTKHTNNYMQLIIHVKMNMITLEMKERKKDT